LMLVFSFFGCASIQTDNYYANLVKEQEFSYYFPSYSFSRSFATTEEAYDYVRAAKAKFASASGKPLTKGLNSKLIGPAISGSQPVTVICTLHAQTRNEAYNLSETEEPLESLVRKAVSSVVLMFVFNEDRAVSLPSYYLQKGYVYSSANQQISSFTIGENGYTTEYPVAWTVEKAFGYLRKETN
ncbi:MAG: hypothetical protein FWH35_05590, partial [Treponema sp.]|nr:hypothetical protein [Treponema sp.]